MIDWSKPIQTRDGREVVIHTRDGKNKNYPVVGEIRGCAHWVTGSWTESGLTSTSNSPGHDLDLVNVPPKKVMVWVNLYPNGTYALHNSKSSARAIADCHGNPVAIAVPVEVDDE